MQNNTLNYVRILALGVSVIGYQFTASVYAQTQEMTRVSVGSVGGLTDAGIILADQLGFFRAQGIDVERKRIASGPALLSAIANNQLQVAGISVTPGLYAAVDQGIYLRIVGDKHMAVASSKTTALVARKASFPFIHDDAFPDMKGKTVAIASKASVVSLQLRDVLAERDQDTGSIRVTEMNYPNMVVALSNGAIDAAVLIEPFLSEALRQDKGLFVPSVACGFMAARPCDAETKRAVSTVPLVYSESFAGNRQLAVRFMVAYMQGVRVYNDAIRKDKNKSGIFQILSDQTGTPMDVLVSGSTPGLDPDQHVDVDYLIYAQDFFLKQGFLTKPIDVKSMIDKSFSEDAMLQLGIYK